MAKTIFLFTVLMVTISIVCSKPTNEEALDKATDNDIVVNSVIQSVPNPKTPTTLETKTEPAKVIESDDQAEVYHTTVSFTTPTAKPGFSLSKIIDDIFQIPIGVLQSVARLLKNPFITPNKTPEAPSSTY